MNLKHKLSSGIKYLTNKNYRFLVNANLGLYNYLNDEEYLKRRYKACIGKDLDIDNPCSFNEKMQWIKLYDRNPLYTKLVDKYEAKKIVSEMIGDEYIIPNLGVWDNVLDIDWEALPKQFVIKATHDSGGVVICKDKNTFDIKAAIKKLNKSLKHDYYLENREWPYKNVKRRIIAEKYMQDDNNDVLIDYKLMCFSGKVKCTFVCTDRFSKEGLKVTFFDNNWERLPFERHYPSSKALIPQPKHLSKMIELAEVLSKDIPFVRVDFYEINGNIYFGEMTFFPGSGFEEFTPIEWDYTLGSWINI